MRLSISYEEIAVLGNRIVSMEQDNPDKDEIYFTLSPMRHGITVNFSNIKFFFFNLKEKIRIQIMAFDGNELIMKVWLKNRFLELLKKVIFKIAFNFLRHHFKDDEEFNIMDYVFISTSRIHIKINDLLKDRKIPFHIQNIVDYGREISIEGEVKKIV